MERYEAILELLERARSRGLETLSSRLDSVARKLEELIKDAQSSLENARPGSTDEIFSLADVESALRAFRDEAEGARRRATELEARIDEMAASHRDEPAAASIDLLRRLDGARSQSELLKELLPAISEHAARAVVLVLRDGRASAWSGIGFADGERLRGWQGDAAESSALATLLKTSRPVDFEPDKDRFFRDWLGDEELPVEILLIPVVLRGKLMGAVYVDRLPGHPWHPEIAQTLVAQVSWLIDTLQYRSTAAPALAEVVGIEPSIGTATVAPPEFGAIGTPAVGMPAPPADDPSATLRIEMPEAVRFEPEAEPEPEPETEPEPEPEPEPGVEAPVSDVDTATTSPIPMTVAPPIAPSAGGDIGGEVEETAEARPSTPTETRFLDEPPPVKPVQPPPALPHKDVSEDEVRLEEARRFARLLVSEIKLYNEEQVERGREACDIYQRLREDIDRSREMFDKRIAAEIRGRQDFFHAELVRILADGNPDLLGM
jgi:hypothetical protein